MIKQFIASVAIIGLAIVLISWGGVGHKKISENAYLSFNQEMSIFNSWTTYLTDHASDADIRKSSDPEEVPKHYIDIDNYSDFNTNGAITQNYAAAIAKYGLSFINTNGTLPWATQMAFDSLTNCLRRNDIAKAKQFAADLGHYVADGYMPLHITKYYDGNNPERNGIHSRYESTMIGNYISSITYSGSSIRAIENVNQYIFNYIYENNKYVDSVLIADNYALNLAGGVRNSTTYKQALWDKTKGYTTKLFKDASHALAELIYTAWIQSQSSTSDEQKPIIQFTEALEQNSPNPFSSFTSIKYNLNENTDVVLQVQDMLGNNVTSLYKGFQTAGSYSVEWYPQNQQAGIYFIVLDTRKIHKVKKMMLVR